MEIGSERKRSWDFQAEASDSSPLKLDCGVSVAEVRKATSSGQNLRGELSFGYLNKLYHKAN